MSDSQKPDRTMTITLEGEAVQDGKVSFAALASKLSAAQTTLYNLGLSKNRGPVAARGSWPEHVRAACELFFVAAEKGSLKVVSELENPNILPNMPDFGLEVLDDFPRMISAVNTNDQSALLSIMPDRTGRQRTLKSLQGLCPRDGDGFQVRIQKGATPEAAIITSATRSRIVRLFQATDEMDDSETQTIIGDLVEIRVKAGNRHIVVKSGQREIDCSYPLEMEETISQLVAGSTVEVAGRVQLTAGGDVKQMDEVLTVDTIDLSPFAVAAFRWDNKQYVLRQSVSCFPAYRGGLWIYECPRYGLHGFSPDRLDALRQLHEDFACVYDGLIDEPDEALTQDAVALKALVSRDVVGVHVR